MEALKNELGTPSLLLDSSLIIATNLKKYDYKVVRCGDYLQLYNYPSINVRNSINKLDIDDLKKEKELNLDLFFESEENLKKEDSLNTITSLEFAEKPKKILDKNIIRTKLELQRIAKTNADAWKSFVTLTYRDNFIDIQASKKHLHSCLTQIARLKPDFKYLCIIEFQKRGAIHYHLLTNLSPQDNNIIVPQKNNNKYYDLKQWKHGFSGYEYVSGDIKKIVGYISKYMSKECDDRLFGFRRYSYSRNLKQAIVEYIDTSDSKQLEYLQSLLKDKTEVFNNTYFDKFDNEVFFRELQTL